MIATKVKRKYVIVKTAITKFERFKPIEIRLLSHLTRITGLMVTASAIAPSALNTVRLGVVNFQACDKTDVFYLAEVRLQGIESSDEKLIDAEEVQFDGDEAWVTGNVPKFKQINIEGDNVFLKAWLKAEKFDAPYVLRIYVECEQAEELTEVEAEGSLDKNDSDLEPLEINL